MGCKHRDFIMYFNILFGEKLLRPVEMPTRLILEYT